MERSPAGFLLVAVGGFAGAVARHGVDVAIGIGLGGATGAGTLAANVLGSFALGVLVTRATSRRTGLLVGTGALSSFTTYSTFVGDAVALGGVSGTGYVAVTYATGFGAALAGLALGGRA